ncbi:uncharacterized protein METZ01_LOCUS431101 [marine metagenome]|uniref:Uncharacterized protein n=1 Tax=marine metagenome TaxID=408172 RepID=A0A382Y4I0_9ZZZZ
MGIDAVFCSRVDFFSCNQLSLHHPPTKSGQQGVVGKRHGRYRSTSKPLFRYKVKA